MSQPSGETPCGWWKGTRKQRRGSKGNRFPHAADNCRIRGPLTRPEMARVPDRQILHRELVGGYIKIDGERMRHREIGPGHRRISNFGWSTTSCRHQYSESDTQVFQFHGQPSFAPSFVAKELEFERFVGTGSPRTARAIAVSSRPTMSSSSASVTMVGGHMRA